ncbi:DNA adenine methylase [Tissierella carlieri]|uniref:site-specific DNA-methyltransferase (adenine-specific) n=1 Tax=Tissierella carlieri TaxID=689904 RepID=A0ABT1S4W7_9FIRM|nr:DNA adenine methylase [Tissierella carlieri]MCQ4921513.1 DNA adenine methylase [Tissierella carlieri]
MSRFLSPLRYPGGKNKLIPSIESLIRNNDLIGSTYIEPFSGGASVALYLLFNNLVSNIYINDIDRSIYAFWYSVVNHNEELCNLIDNAILNIDEWNKQKSIQENKDTSDLLSLGFSTFYLNRTNRSGIIKGGVMGGIDQTGKYKMDCRFNKVELIKRIKRIGTISDKINIFNLDTLELLEEVYPNIENTCFLYFDPPYYKKGSQLYVNFYNHDDHVALSNSIKRLEDDYWIVTYDNEENIKEMYSEYRQDVYDLSYTVQTKYTGQEIIIYSANLNFIL